LGENAVTTLGDEASAAQPAMRGRSGSQILQLPRPARKRRAGAEDVEIGRKIRALRLQRGLSQTSLAGAIGLTFQQVQKYEKGTNRVSAGRLQKIADLLDTPITFFYRGMGAPTRKRETDGAGLALVQSKGALRLLRSYAEISSRSTKYALVVLAESLRDKERR
jgi:transcriptional regulator with XRE-family HTH domain